MKKILVIQLARLGDIYMSWPVIRALKRQHPLAEMHVLTRPRFEGALDGLEAVDHRRSLPTQELLEPLCRDDYADDQAFERFGYYVDSLKAEGFDLILNLSFSPFSSYLTDLVRTESSHVLGYGRHSDGWLAIADDVSSYFYSQVGIGRGNRVHLTDLFAAIANVDLSPEDFRAPSSLGARAEHVSDGPVVVHVGASEAGKTLMPFQWARVIRLLHQKSPRTRFVLLGAGGEAPLAEAILAQTPDAPVENRVGANSLKESFELLNQASLLIGADSAPMHMATLAGTPCLNLSFAGVNFWETGPKAAGSQIWLSQTPADASTEGISDAAVMQLRGETHPLAIPLAEGIPCYAMTEQTEGGDFAWKLLQALYLGAEFPMADSLEFVEAVEKINDMNKVVLETLEQPGIDSNFLGQLVDRADEVMGAVAKLQGEAAIYVRWIQAEKSRIAPSNTDSIKVRMKELHGQLGILLRPYLFAEEEKGHGDGAV